MQIGAHLPSVFKRERQRDGLRTGRNGWIATVTIAVMFVDFKCGGFSFGHGANGLADDRKKEFASELTLAKRNRREFVAVAVLGFERKYNIVIIIERNFVTLVRALGANRACNLSNNKILGNPSAAQRGKPSSENRSSGPALQEMSSTSN